MKKILKKNHLDLKILLKNKIEGKLLGPVNAPIFRLRKVNLE